MSSESDRNKDTTSFLTIIEEIFTSEPSLTMPICYWIKSSNSSASGSYSKSSSFGPSPKRSIPIQEITSNNKNIRISNNPMDEFPVTKKEIMITPFQSPPTTYWYHHHYNSNNPHCPTTNLKITAPNYYHSVMSPALKQFGRLVLLASVLYFIFKRRKQILEFGMKSHELLKIKFTKVQENVHDICSTLKTTFWNVYDNWSLMLVNMMNTCSWNDVHSNDKNEGENKEPVKKNIVGNRGFGNHSSTVHEKEDSIIVDAEFSDEDYVDLKDELSEHKQVCVKCLLNKLQEMEERLDQVCLKIQKQEEQQQQGYFPQKQQKLQHEPSKFNLHGEQEKEEERQEEN